jgi:hypothetical protein
MTSFAMAYLPRFTRPLPALALLLATTLAPWSAQAARLALVIGNDAYQHVNPLRNARNDAQSMAKELEAAGFSVTKVLDASRQTVNTALDGFLQRINKGDEVVFFFSGHGSQPPQTGAMLLPVDIEPSSERVIQRDGLSLEVLTDDLNKRARFALVIVDACRDDPFRQTSAGRSIAPGSGLGRMEPPKGTMVILAASKGQQALDRLSEKDPVSNGLFTRELIRHMRTPGLSASEVLKRVRTSVEESAAAVNHAQRPALMDESSSEFYFYPAPAEPARQAAKPSPSLLPSALPSPSPVALPEPARPSAAPRPAQAPQTVPAARTTPQSEFEAYRNAVNAEFEAFRNQQAGSRSSAPAPAAQPAGANAQAEADLWELTTRRGGRVDYENYLKLYPNGRYSDIARARLR